MHMNKQGHKLAPIACCLALPHRLLLQQSLVQPFVTLIAYCSTQSPSNLQSAQLRLSPPFAAAFLLQTMKPAASYTSHFTAAVF